MMATTLKSMSAASIRWKKFAAPSPRRSLRPCCLKIAAMSMGIVGSFSYYYLAAVFTKRVSVPIMFSDLYTKYVSENPSGLVVLTWGLPVTIT